MYNIAAMEDRCLAQYKPNQSHVAKRDLERQGFATFLPLERETRIRAQRFTKNTRPYFPVFLIVAPGERAWVLLDIMGRRARTLLARSDVSHARLTHPR